MREVAAYLSNKGIKVYLAWAPVTIMDDKVFLVQVLYKAKLEEIIDHIVQLGKDEVALYYAYHRPYSKKEGTPPRYVVRFGVAS